MRCLITMDLRGSIGLGEGSLTFCRTIRELVESDKKGS